jgi:hypothetical protein
MARHPLIALVIAVACLAGGWLEGSAAQTNLIPNPGFEHDSDSDGTPDSWRKEGSGESLLLEEKGHAGAQSLSMEGKGMWRCRFNGPVPKGWYLFSVWVKRDGFMDGEYPIVRFLNREITCDELFTWGRWVRISRLLYLEAHPAGGEMALVNPGMRHTVWFDEVSLVPFVVHPLSPRKGQVISHPPPLFAWSMPEDGRVYEIRIELKGDKGFKKIYTTYSPQGNLLWLPEPLPPGRYHWRIRVYHNSRRIAASKKIGFAVSQALRPATGTGPVHMMPLRSLDGFFPIGIYGAPLEALRELKATGFNAVQTSRREAGFLQQFIQQAAEAGLTVLISPPDAEDAETLHGFLKDIKASPTILAWYLADEPEGRGIAPASIWRWRRFLRSYTPFPGALVVVRAERAWDYAPTADILMIDTYPIPHMPLTWLSDSLEEARQWTGGRPVWAVIQAFDWSDVPLKDDPRAWGRYPTYEEERCLSYLAVVHGAQGLFYYTFEAQKFGTTEYRRHWDNIKKVIAELRSIYPLLLASIVEKPKVHVDRPQIHWAVKQVAQGQGGGAVPAGHYLIAVNTIDKPLTATFTIPFFTYDAVDVVFEKRKVSTQKGRLADAFEPYGVHVYGPLQLDSAEDL